MRKIFGPPRHSKIWTCHLTAPFKDRNAGQDSQEFRDKSIENFNLSGKRVGYSKCYIFENNVFLIICERTKLEITKLFPSFAFTSNCYFCLEKSIKLLMEHSNKSVLISDIIQLLVNNKSVILPINIKIACMVQIWEKTFCQDSEKFGYRFIKNDIMFMFILCIY